MLPIRRSLISQQMLHVLSSVCSTWDTVSFLDLFQIHIQNWLLDSTVSILFIINGRIEHSFLLPTIQFLTTSKTMTPFYESFQDRLQLFSLQFYSQSLPSISLINDVTHSMYIDSLTLVHVLTSTFTHNTTILFAKLAFNFSCKRCHPF